MTVGEKRAMWQGDMDRDRLLPPDLGKARLAEAGLAYLCPLSGLNKRSRFRLRWPIQP
jgi:hypothetical protein